MLWRDIRQSRLRDNAETALCRQYPVLMAWTASSKIRSPNATHPYMVLFSLLSRAMKLFTLAQEYHYGDPACHTCIFSPRSSTLQQNIKVNRGENCMGATCGTWYLDASWGCTLCECTIGHLAFFLLCHSKGHICVDSWQPRPWRDELKI